MITGRSGQTKVAKNYSEEEDGELDAKDIAAFVVTNGTPGWWGNTHPWRGRWF